MELWNHNSLIWPVLSNEVALSHMTHQHNSPQPPPIVLYRYVRKRISVVQPRPVVVALAVLFRDRLSPTTGYGADGGQLAAARTDGLVGPNVTVLAQPLRVSAAVAQIGLVPITLWNTAFKNLACHRPPATCLRSRPAHLQEP
jgi:hypothetical protein